MQQLNNISEIEIKHLEFIQSVITRMNTNSFQIKNWCVAIISAFLAIYASNRDAIFILIAIIPTIVFWFLDSYYLMQERKFRGLYNDVAKLTSFANIKMFEMNPIHYKGKKYSYFNVLKSTTMLLLYRILILILIALYCVLINI